MRYVAFNEGLVLAPSSYFSHKDMVCLAESKSEPVSAGFLDARYSPTKEWKSYGRSVSLNLDSAPVSIPDVMWVGVWTVQGIPFLLYATSPDLLKNCENVKLAKWGMSKEGLWGTCAVYAPLHPDFDTTADDFLGT